MPSNPFLRNLGVVLVKTETTEGVDAVPTAAANAIPIVSFRPTPRSEFVDITRITNTLSPAGGVTTLHSFECEIEQEWRGTGTIPTATPPNTLNEDPLFRAAGMVPTYATGPNTATYAPTSSFYGTVSTCTVYAYIAPGPGTTGLLFKMTGCRANLAISAEIQNFARLRWRIMGALGPLSLSPAAGDAIIDASMPATPTFQGGAVTADAVQGCTLTSDAYGAIASSVTVDLNNTINRRLSMAAANGILSFFISGRNPTGTINPEACLRADYDFYQKWKAGTRANITWSVGTTPNKLTLNIPKAQWRGITLDEREGLYINNNEFLCSKNVADDEVTLQWS